MKKINNVQLGLILNEVLESTYEFFKTNNPTTAISFEGYCEVVKDYIKEKQAKGKLFKKGES